MRWTFGLWKKDIYVDGHEREDVVAYRAQFLQEMLDLEQSMIIYDDITLEPLPNNHLADGKCTRHILVTHDESTFQANDDMDKGWGPKGEQKLRKKSRGRGLMVSDFLLDTVGRLAVPMEQYSQMAAAFPPEACKLFEYGKNNDGYWTGEHLVKQVCD